MKTGFRLAAVAVILVALVFWFFGGAHRGVSATSVQVKIPDPVTGLDEVRWEKRLVLGVDFLAASAGLAAVLFGASWLFNRRFPSTSHPT